MDILGKKSGIGIVEVLIAAAVLGLLYTALLNLQGGSHDALLRIRGRDGATEVAQNLIDSIGALGVGRLTDGNLVNEDGTLMLATTNSEGDLVPDTIRVTREWKGQPGLVEHTMQVDYKAVVAVSSDADYRARTSSALYANAGIDSATHVYAKRLDVTVSWKFKSSMQSITVSGVIR